METRGWSGWNREAEWGRKEGEGGVRSRGKEEGKQETCKIRTERGGDIVRSPMVAQRDGRGMKASGRRRKDDAHRMGVQSG